MYGVGPFLVFNGVMVCMVFINGVLFLFIGWYVVGMLFMAYGVYGIDIKHPLRIFKNVDLATTISRGKAIKK